MGGTEASVSLEFLFQNYLNHSPRFVAHITLYPPTDRCTYDGCDGTKVMKKSQTRNIVVYTLDGAYPAIAVHLTCDSEFYP